MTAVIARLRRSRPPHVFRNSLSCASFVSISVSFSPSRRWTWWHRSCPHLTFKDLNGYLNKPIMTL